MQFAILQFASRSHRTIESFKLCQKLMPVLGFLRHRHSPCPGKWLLDAVPCLQGELSFGFRTFRSGTERSFTLNTYPLFSLQYIDRPSSRVTSCQLHRGCPCASSWVSDSAWDNLVLWPSSWKSPPLDIDRSIRPSSGLWRFMYSAKGN